jgi:DNA repair photolyase
MSIIYEPSGKAREYSPLAANLFRGCIHGCKYCYAPACIHVKPEVFHSSSVSRAGVLSDLSQEASKRHGQQTEVLLSFTSDLYQPIPGNAPIVRQALRILSEHKIPFTVLTKGGTRAIPDFDLYSDRDTFASTLTFINPNDSLEWEPKAALPADRVETIKQAHANKMRTWVSLEPVIDPAQTLELIRMTAKYVDLFKVGILNHHELTKTIDWQAFGAAAVDLLKSLGKAYYLKADLRKHLLVAA